MDQNGGRHYVTNGIPTGVRPLGPDDAFLYRDLFVRVVRDSPDIRAENCTPSTRPAKRSSCRNKSGTDPCCGGLWSEPLVS